MAADSRVVVAAGTPTATGSPPTAAAVATVQTR
jgi:hypothetical protein